MPNWFAYGEDPLTYWALRTRLDVILSQLHDTFDPNEATVFYRPSFGRRGSKTTDSPRAEFGEFDAILATSNAIYPIEAKWTASSEAQETAVTIRPVQITRHRIFEWYLAHYAECDLPSWDRFVEICDSDFRATFPGKKIAPPGSKLACNTEFVLRQLIPSSTITVDVLLYLHPQDLPPATLVAPDSFTLVNIPFTSQSKGGIFSL